MTSNVYRTVAICGLALSVILAVEASPAVAQPVRLWGDGHSRAALVSPELTGATDGIAERTINGFLKKSYGWTLPRASDVALPGLYVVVGDPENNAILQALVEDGLELENAELGEEGFRILSHETGERRFVVVYANTPVGLKHGCQELVFYRMHATSDAVSVEWPLDVTMKPAVAYRGCYMLPCWSAYDSLQSWRRALEFNSELTLNRNWFWLNGFPLLQEYGGIYERTALADPKNVRELIDLCHTHGMKFLIGGGWFTWHHKESASGSREHRVAQVGAGGGETPIAADAAAINKGVQYYLDLVAALPEADGIYLEPTGEGAEAQGNVWREHVDALQRLSNELWKERPEFELAIAIGQFNSREYRHAVHTLAPKNLRWFWAWGNPLADNALAEHPLVLRWHTTQAMSHFHGSSSPPRPAEAALTGQVTSWDPGMGFGNPWNGWAKIGVDKPRNFDPYTMPYFSHQYRFRERCWNLELTEEEFAERLSRRLFDADMPAESIQMYLELAEMCPEPERADPQALRKIAAFVERHEQHGTARNRDTLLRMQEAIAGIYASSAK